MSYGLYDWKYSPIEELNYNNYVNTDNRLRLNGRLDAKVLPWIKLSLAGMLQKSFAESNQLDELDSYTMRTFLNTASTVDFKTGRLTRNLPQGGRLVLGNQRANAYNLRFQADIEKSWNNWIDLNMIVGTEIGSQSGMGYDQTRYGFNEDTYSSAAFNPTTPYMTIPGWTQTLGYSDGSVSRPNTRTLSYYTNGAVSLWKGKYVLSGSARFDDHTLVGASREVRAKPLWSTGLKWNVKAEDFMKQQDWLSQLDVRLTYGLGGIMPQTGSNVAILEFSQRDAETGEVTGIIRQPANPQVGWEKVHTYNYGLDFGLLNNRLSVSVDYYTKKTKDILAEFKTNPTIGWGQMEMNGGTMESKGVDLGISGAIINKGDFKWNSIFNFSYNTNKVTDSRYTTDNINNVLGTNILVGRPVDNLFVYNWGGLDERGQTLIRRADGVLVNSLNQNNETKQSLGFPPFKVEDLNYVGRTTAPYFGAFMNSFNYKQFNLGVRLSYYLGHIVRKTTVTNYPTYAQYNGFLDAHTDLLDRWRAPGDEATKVVPGIANINQNSFNRFKESDLMVIDGGHVRLQQISLGYNFSHEMLKRLPLKSLSFSASVRNLGIIWRANKEGIDPSYVRNNSYNNLPPTRNYFLSLSTTF